MVSIFYFTILELNFDFRPNTYLDLTNSNIKLDNMKFLSLNQLNKK